VLFILYNAESAQCGNGKQYLKKIIKNYLNKEKSVFKIHSYLLDFDTCVAFTVSFEN
jgi:hypothetical protein